MTITIPNYLTLLRLAAVPTFIYLFFSPNLNLQIAATFLFILGAVTDLLDGKLARRLNQVTPFGALIDPIADKIIVLTGYWAILIREGLGSFWFTAALWVVIITIRELAITIRRISAVESGSPITTSRLAKWKTGIALTSLIALFLMYNCRDYLSAIGSHPAIVQWFGSPAMFAVTDLLFFIGAVPTVLSGLFYLRDSAVKPEREQE